MIPQSSEISSLFRQVFSVIEGGEPVQVTFRNNFNLQDGFDGGVLELSTDGGNTFQDILTFGSFVSGGYHGTISNCCGNPLAGREAWTGNSSGFITTMVNLGVTWGPNMVLRWRMGSDNNVSGEGWRIDTVAITQCHKPYRRRRRLSGRLGHVPLRRRARVRSGSAPKSHSFYECVEDKAFHLCSPKDTAQFIFGAFENAFLHRRQVFSRSIDVEIQHRHCGLIRCALAPFTLFCGVFQ